MRRLQRGQSAAEMAVALPVLVLLFSAVLDLGRTAYYTITVTDAARDGARMLVSNTAGVGPGTTAGCAAVTAATASLHTTPSCPTTSSKPAADALLVGISCPDAGGLCVGPSHNKPVTVDVYYGFTLMTPVMSAFVSGGVITLHGHAVMDSSW